MIPHPRSKKQDRKGFTLIITISLLVLLTLVGIGILSLSAVTLRTGGQSNAQRIARDNARMALMIALGQLQKHAGSDTRVTATADIAAGTGGIAAAPGAAPINNTSVNSLNKGLSAVQNGSRFWTGVWSNRDAASLIYNKTPSPYLVQWLVSGNEINYATLTTPHAGILPNSGDISVSSSGAVPDAQKAVVLAGNYTIGDPGASTVPNYVAAPLVKISTDGTGNAAGRYAWWVGDEGVKAKINIPQTNKNNTEYASLTAQRRGWDAVAGFAQYPLPTAPGNAELVKLSSVPQTSLLMPSVTTQTGGVSPLQSVFHSATADSYGLLVDNLNGGLKVDLHNILSNTLPTATKLPAVANYPVRGTNIIPRSYSRTLVAPRWDTLKDFYDLSKTLTSGSLAVKAATNVNSPSISPLITDFRMLMGLRFVPSGAGFKANACGKIAIVIANPYSVPLRWTNDMEVEVRNSTPSGNLCSRVWALGGNSVFVGNPGEAAVFNNTFFRIRSGVLEPGEARGYTLSGYTMRPQGSVARIVVDLAPVTSANPLDFSYCVELDAPGVYTSFSALDVRESWQTCTVDVDLKLAGGSGSAQSLCRVERFELDNGYFAPNLRNFTTQQCTDTRARPVGLMCYNFEISRPGTDYLQYMPQGVSPAYTMGQRGSSLRTFYDFNLHATRFYKSVTSYNPAPFFMQSTSSFSELPIDGTTGPAFTRNLASNPLPWGRSLSSGSKRTILFTVPKQFTSLAQFQHADLTGDDIAGSLGHQPAYAVGNSYANPFVKRTLTKQSRNEYQLAGTPNQLGVNPTQRNYYDIAHLLNTALWDSYFLSAIPYGGGASSYGSVSENPAMVAASAATSDVALNDPVTAASQLMVDGAFNVNSTDVNAWKAFLGSSKHFQHVSDTAPSTGAAFPRALDQLTTAANPPTGAEADSFSGYRRLTDAELNAFAVEMVKQVRLRGPFLSHSHFVNRALGDITRQTALTRSGALQSAIDESGVNISIDGTKKSFRSVVSNTDRVTLTEHNGAPRADLDGSDTTLPLPNQDSSTPDWAVTSTDNNYGSVASILADREQLKTLKNEQGFRSTAIPAWLTQADVLQVIGPAITPRSDTFRIRAYGEAVDASGKTSARAYCEAIVQRTPDYVDPTNDATIRGTALSPINRLYGRKFEIVSFRWLSAQEI